MKQFKVNSLYAMRSACDQNCVWQYIVTARTVSTVTLRSVEGKTLKCRINKAVSEYRGAETVFPLGRYSMAPMLTAY